MKKIEPEIYQYRSIVTFESGFIDRSLWHVCDKDEYVFHKKAERLAIGQKETRKLYTSDALLAVAEAVRDAIHEYNGVDVSQVDLRAIISQLTGE